MFLLSRSISLSFIISAQTIFIVGMLMSTIPTGILADKWGQKRIIQSGLVIDSLGMLLLLLIHSNLGLLISFDIRGIGVGFRDGADEVLLYNSYNAENKLTTGYSKEYARLLSNDILGFVVSTGLAGLAVQLFGTRSYAPLIVITAITSLFTLAIASTLQDKMHTVNNLVKKPSYFAQVANGVKFVKKSHVLVALTVFSLLTMNGEYFLRQTYQPHFQRLAVPAIFLGVALSFGKLLNFFAMRNVHKLEDYFDVDKILLWINLVIGFLFCVLTISRSVWSVVVVFISIQALLNLQQPIVSAWATRF